MGRVMEEANVYERRLKGVKLAFAPGDARAAHGRVKQLVRWAAPGTKIETVCALYRTGCCML